MPFDRLGPGYTGMMVRENTHQREKTLEGPNATRNWRGHPANKISEMFEMKSAVQEGIKRRLFQRLCVPDLFLGQGRSPPSRPLCKKAAGVPPAF